MQMVSGLHISIGTCKQLRVNVLLVKADMERIKLVKNAIILAYLVMALMKMIVLNVLPQEI